MAFAVDRDALATAIRERGEIRTQFVSNAELLRWVNQSIAQLYRFIVGVNPDWYLSSGNISVTADTNAYALPATFWLDRGADIKINGEWVNLQPFNWGERNRLQNAGGTREQLRYRVVGSSLYLFPTPRFTETNAIRLWFVPTPPQFAGPIGGGAETWEAWAGLDEWVLLNCCIINCAKEETDASLYIGQLKKLQDEIVSAVQSRSAGEPDRVRDVEAERFFPGYGDPWP